MSPVATDLVNTLLEHRRAVLHRSHGALPDPDGAVLPYGDLWERIGSPEDLGRVGAYLKEVAGWCADHGWPPLNALVVNGKKRRPGRRYNEAPGCSLDRWEQDVRACLEFTGYPDTVG